MRIDGVIWLRHIVDKLASKHQVTPEEVDASQLSEVARAKKVSSEKLLNSWLRERLRKASQVSSAMPVTSELHRLFSARLHTP